MKGWYGNREKHKLASKGIRTKVKLYKSSGNYDYYNQLLPIIEEYMEGYKTDFTKWDKQDYFDKGINEFMIFLRKNGTHFEPIDMEFNENKTPEQRIGNLNYYPTDESIYERVFYGVDGKIVELTKDEAYEILEKRIEETEKERKIPITDFPKVENYDIYEWVSNAIDERQYYGTRTVDVIPKKRYTHGRWSNGDASWHFDTMVIHDSDSIVLDTDEILIPYSIDQVLGISYALQPHPLFSYSYEAKEMYGAEEQENITRQWALKQIESKVHDKSASDYERMSAQVMLTKIKNELGLEPDRDKRGEWL